MVESSSYYPSGMRFGESAVNGGSVQPYRHTGLEMQEMHGLNWIDNLARFRTVSDGSGFTGVDPLAEKYYSISPYAYCAGNPVNRIDINGDSISAEQQESQQMITNTLTTEDAKYVQFNEDGDINMDLLTSHSSDSGNYNDLVTMATSDLWTLVSLDDKYTCVDNEGNTKPEYPMIYQQNTCPPGYVLH